MLPKFSLLCAAAAFLATPALSVDNCDKNYVIPSEAIDARQHSFISLDGIRSQAAILCKPVGTSKNPPIVTLIEELRQYESIPAVGLRMEWFFGFRDALNDPNKATAVDQFAQALREFGKEQESLLPTFNTKPPNKFETLATALTSKTPPDFEAILTEVNVKINEIMGENFGVAKDIQKWCKSSGTIIRPGKACEDLCGLLNKLTIHPGKELLPMDQHTFTSKVAGVTGMADAWKRIAVTKAFCGAKPSKCDRTKKCKMPGKVCVEGFMNGGKYCLPPKKQ